MGYMCLFQFWFPQGTCLGVELLGHMVALFLVFRGISIPSFIVAVSTLKIWNASRICISSLHRGHANLLCIFPVLVYVLLKRALETCLLCVLN